MTDIIIADYTHRHGISKKCIYSVQYFFDKINDNEEDISLELCP